MIDLPIEKFDIARTARWMSGYICDRGADVGDCVSMLPHVSMSFGLSCDVHRHFVKGKRLYLVFK
jgi:hypothetical protein